MKLKMVAVLTASLLLTACDTQSTEETNQKAATYPKQDVSGFNINYPTTFDKNREETEKYFQLLPDAIQDLTTEMLVYKAKPICDLAEVRLVYFKMHKMASYDIDMGAQGIIDNIAMLEGMEQINSAFKPLTFSGFQGRQVFFEGKMRNENVSYEGLLVADTTTNRVWQLQFISDVNSKTDNKKYQERLECTQNFINTVTITK